MDHTPSRAASVKAALLLGIVLYLTLSALSTYSWSAGPNYRNVSIDTRVNITNSLPTVLSVIVNDGANNLTNITLNAGSVKYVYCNVTVRDFDNIAQINVSATFYQNLSPVNTTTPDDNNTHYTNASCNGGTPAGFFRNYSCAIPVQYYANVDRWLCNATATDPFPFVGGQQNQSLSNFTHIDSLLALNVTPLIDYGNLAVGDTSAVQQANVTNYGNVGINVSVKGYGAILDDGLAFNCSVGNISIQYEKYNTTDSGQVLANYVNLTSVLTQIPRLTVAQQTNDSQQSLNATYWLLYVPPNPFGLCNGTVIFQAEKST